MADTSTTSPGAKIEMSIIASLPGFRIERGGEPLMIEVGLLPGDKLFYRDQDQFLTMEELTRRILDRALFPQAGRLITLRGMVAGRACFQLGQLAQFSQVRQRSGGFLFVHLANGEPYMHHDILAGLGLRKVRHADLAADAAEIHTRHGDATLVMQFGNPARNRQAHKDNSMVAG